MSHFEATGAKMDKAQYVGSSLRDARPATPVESEMARLKAPLASVEKMLADLHDRLRPVLSAADGVAKPVNEPEPPCSPLESDLREIKSRIVSLATRLEVIQSSLRL